jgi:hypothetical protein
MAIPAIIPLTLSAISTGASVIQGIEARKQVRAAERAADDALAAAKRKIAIDRFEALKVPTEAYQFAADIQTQQGKQNLMALQEAGPRALAAGVGKVTAAGIQGTEQARQGLQADLFGLEKLQATEAAKRDTALSAIDLGEVKGAALASMAAEEQAAAAFGGAFQTAAGAGLDVYKASDLYGTDFAGRQVKNALDKGLIAPDQVGDYTKYIESISRADLRGMSESQLTEGFESFLNPYGYDPATGGGMSLGTPKQMSVDSVDAFGYEFLGQ